MSYIAGQRRHTRLEKCHEWLVKNFTWLVKYGICQICHMVDQKMVYMVSQIWHMWLLQTWSIKHIMCGLKKSHAWPFKYIICSRLNTSCVAGQTRHPWLVNTLSMAGQHLIYGWSNTRGQANRSCVIKQTFYTWLDKCHGWSNISNVASQTRRIYRHSLFVQPHPLVG